MESSKVLENRRIDMLARRNLYVLLSNRCPIAGQMLEIWGEEGLDGYQGRVLDR